MNENENRQEQQEEQQPTPREIREAARRLAMSLRSSIDRGYAGINHDRLKQLAQLLFYQPSQLLEDIEALDEYTQKKAYEDAAAEQFSD